MNVRVVPVIACMLLLLPWSAMGQVAPPFTPSQPAELESEVAWRTSTVENVTDEADWWVTPRGIYNAGLNVARAGALGIWLTQYDDDERRNHGEDVYGIGDSVLTAKDKRTNDLRSQGRDSFVNKFGETAGAESYDHSMRGRGKGTTWALQHWAQYLPNPVRAEQNDVFIIALGSNDYRFHNGALSPQQTADNLLILYQLYTMAQPDSLVLIMEPFPKNPDQPVSLQTKLEGQWLSWENQRELIGTIDRMCIRNDLPCFRSWDVLDSEPFNGRLDEYSAVNQDAYDVNGHPDVDGHQRLGDALAADLPRLAAIAGVPVPTFSQ